MSVFKKIKDVLFDIEEEEEIVPVKKEKPVVDTNPIKEIKITRELEDSSSEIVDVPKKTSNFNFPLDFDDEIPTRDNSVKKDNFKSYPDNSRRSFYDDDDYDIPRRNKSDYIVKEPERKKEEVRDYSKYLQPKKEEKKIFTPSPVISPVYGVLNQNYTKDDVIVKTDIGVKTPSLDEVRNKAYNKVKPTPKNEVDEFEEPLKTLDEILINSNNIIEEPLENDILPEVEEEKEVVKEEVFQEIEQDVNLEVKENIDSSDDDKLENDLFNLIDSMYEDKEEEEE